jgi:WD40 repeat protein
MKEATNDVSSRHLLPEIFAPVNIGAGAQVGKVKVSILNRKIGTDKKLTFLEAIRKSTHERLNIQIRGRGFTQDELLTSARYQQLSCSKFNSDEVFSLNMILKDFLVNNNTVLALLGDSGSGKTLALLKMFVELSKNKESIYIPVFITLREKIYAGENAANCIEVYFKSLGAKDKHIPFLQQLKDKRFIFIFDGYDEISKENKPRVNIMTQLANWPTCKAIVSCRTHYLRNLEHNRIIFQSEVNTIFDASYEEYTIKPLTETQITAYIETLSLEVKERCLVLKQTLKSSDLLSNPLLLWIFTNVPHILASRNVNNNLPITRLDIYDALYESWFKSEYKKIVSSSSTKLSPQESLEKLNELTECLAEQMLILDKHEVELKATDNDSLGIKRDEYDTFRLEKPLYELLNSIFNSTDYKNTCPIKLVRDDCIAFIHSSVRDYFAVQKLVKYFERSLDNFITIINKRSLILESNVIEFFVEWLKKKKILLNNDKYRQLIDQLFDIIFLSREDETKAPGATILMTILCAAKVPFSDRNLSGIKIPGAILDDGIFHRTILSGPTTNLEQVTLYRAYLCESDIRGANLKNVRFGRLTSLGMNFLSSAIWVESRRSMILGTSNGLIFVAEAEITGNFIWHKHIGAHQSKVNAIVISQSADSVVSCDSDGNLCLFKLNNGLQFLSKTIQAHQDEILSIVFTQDNEIISGDNSGLAKRWRIVNNKFICVQDLQYHTTNIRALAIHPQTSIVISGGDDKLLVFWERSKQNQLYYPAKIFPLDYKITCVCISETGRYVVCGTDKGIVYLFTIIKNSLIMDYTNDIHIKRYDFSKPDERKITTLAFYKDILLFIGRNNIENYILDTRIDRILSVSYLNPPCKYAHFRLNSAGTFYLGFINKNRISPINLEDLKSTLEIDDSNRLKNLYRMKNLEEIKCKSHHIDLEINPPYVVDDFIYYQDNYYIAKRMSEKSASLITKIDKEGKEVFKFENSIPNSQIIINNISEIIIYIYLNTVEVRTLNGNHHIYKQELSNKITCSMLLDNDILICGHQDGGCSILHLQSQKEVVLPVTSLRIERIVILNKRRNTFGLLDERFNFYICEYPNNPRFILSFANVLKNKLENSSLYGDVYFHSILNLIIFCDNDKYLYIYDINNKKLIWMKQFTHNIFSVYYSIMNPYILLGDIYGVLHIFDPSKPTIVASIKAHGAAIQKIINIDNYHYASIGYEDSVIKIWRIIEPPKYLQLIRIFGQDITLLNDCQISLNSGLSQSQVNRLKKTSHKLQISLSEDSCSESVKALSSKDKAINEAIDDYLNNDELLARRLQEKEWHDSEKRDETRSFVPNPADPENRKGLTINFAYINQIIQLPEGYIWGTAVNDGGCFFDALSQRGNLIDGFGKHDEKSLRMLCHKYYLKNKAKVDKWNREEFGGIDGGNEDYYFIQFIASELKSFRNRSPIWGRPEIEGRILCEILNIPAIYIIELGPDPENKPQLIVNYLKVTKDGAKQVDQIPYGENVPILVVSENEKHFVPLLPMLALKKEKKSPNIDSCKETKLKQKDEHDKDDDEEFSDKHTSPQSDLTRRGASSQQSLDKNFDGGRETLTSKQEQTTTPFIKEVMHKEPHADASLAEIQNKSSNKGISWQKEKVISQNATVLPTFSWIERNSAAKALDGKQAQTPNSYEGQHSYRKLKRLSV